MGTKNRTITAQGTYLVISKVGDWIIPYSNVITCKICYNGLPDAEEAEVDLLKTRKIGNSVGVIIPAEYEIGLGTELLIGKGSDGQFIITTPLGDPFEDATDFADMEDEFKDVVPAGREFGADIDS